jgi:hypothetical protein
MISISHNSDETFDAQPRDKWRKITGPNKNIITLKTRWFYDIGGLYVIVVFFCDILSAEMKSSYISYKNAIFNIDITAVGFSTDGIIFNLKHNILITSTLLISNASDTRLERISH